MEKTQLGIVSEAIECGSRGDAGLPWPVEDQKGAGASLWSNWEFPLLSKSPRRATAGSNFASVPMDRENILQNSQKNITTSTQASTKKRTTAK